MTTILSECCNCLPFLMTWCIKSSYLAGLNLPLKEERLANLKSTWFLGVWPMQSNQGLLEQRICILAQGRSTIWSQFCWNLHHRYLQDLGLSRLSSGEKDIPVCRQGPEVFQAWQRALKQAAISRAQEQFCMMFGALCLIISSIHVMHLKNSLLASRGLGYHRRSGCRCTDAGAHSKNGLPSPRPYSPLAVLEIFWQQAANWITFNALLIHYFWLCMLLCARRIQGSSQKSVGDVSTSRPAVKKLLLWKFLLQHSVLNGVALDLWFSFWISFHSWGIVHTQTL